MTLSYTRRLAGDFLNYYMAFIHACSLMAPEKSARACVPTNCATAVGCDCRDAETTEALQNFEL